MKRNSPLARKTPLRAHSELKRAPMRKRSRKSSPATRSAQGQDCTLQFPGCQNARETVVLCHVRQLGGGGIGLKPPHNESCYACAWCHDRLDFRVPWIRDMPEGFNFWEAICRAIIRTQRVMRANGILVFKGEEAA